MNTAALATRHVWRLLIENCRPGAFVPPAFGVPSSTSRPACDALGIFAVPWADVELAGDRGLDRPTLRLFLPRVDGGVAFSRGAPYYAPAQGLRALDSLVDCCQKVTEFADDVPALAFALLENAHNLVAAATFTLWQQCCLPGPGPRAATTLDASLAAGAALAGALSSRWDGTPVPRGMDLDWGAVRHATRRLAATPLRQLRAFRELDSAWKVAAELGFVASMRATAALSLDALVFPLYGATAIGLAARALAENPAGPLAGVRVHLVQLGFHDLGHIPFLSADGSVRVETLAPPSYLSTMSRDLAGARVLVIDDNVGYGTTLRACRSVVEQFGGECVTRSVETAWDLYDRVAGHDITTAVDIPGLRPNLHHSVHRRLIELIVGDDPRRYLVDPAHATRQTLPDQMAASLAVAGQHGRWSRPQRATMRAELDFSRQTHREPAVPGRGA